MPNNTSKPTSTRNTDPANDKTVINPDSVGKTVVPSSTSSYQAELPNSNAVTESGNTQNHNERTLTKIGNAVRSQDTSKGFETAKEIVNQALDNKNIILNKRFVLEYILGAGGMGTVYQARDLRKIEANDRNSNIAVKVLNNNFKDHPDAFVALQREASRSQLLSHPNIVTVHDFDRDGNVIYMTMELLNGEDLDVFIRKNELGLPVEKAYPIVSDYCQALIYAHKKNIIHSDLKPGNIFIGENGTKVLDFGIARVTKESSIEHDFDAGSLGAITPAYASLEMLNNEDDPHPSDDVYAAAVIAYELLTGKHPYNRKPADEAHAEKLEPEYIKGLSKRQWRSLASALKLTRCERTTSIEEFLSGFTEKRHTPALLITGAALLCIILWQGYQVFFSFDPLAEKIESTLAKGNECLQEDNFTCAIETAKATLKLSPEHTEAQSLLTIAERKYLFQRTQTLMAELSVCVTVNQDLDCAKSTLTTITNLSTDVNVIRSAEHQIQRLIDNLKVLGALTEGLSCLEAEDFLCSIEQALTAINIDPSNIQAAALLKQSQAQLTNLSINNKNFTEAIGNANNCLSLNNYICAVKFSNTALGIQPNDPTASMIKKSAELALADKKEKLKSTQAIVKKGEECFKSSKYDCAIASAESALRLIPSYEPALILKKLGMEENLRLKSQIIFQTQ